MKLSLHKIQIAAITAAILVLHAQQQMEQPQQQTVTPVMIAATRDVAVCQYGVFGLKVESHLTSPPSDRNVFNIKLKHS